MEQLSAKETMDLMWDNLKVNNILDKWGPSHKDFDIVYESVFNFIENDMKKHGSKTLSRKMKLRLNATRFQLDIDDDVYFYYSVSWGKKLNHEIYDIYKAVIMKTSMGRVYVVPVAGALFCFVAHFFDRMKQRNENLSEYNRRQMIDQYIHNELLKNSTIKLSNNNASVSLFTRSGVALGIGSLLRYKEKDLTPFLIIKTFLSRKTLTPEHIYLETQSVPLDISLYSQV